MTTDGHNFLKNSITAILQNDTSYCNKMCMAEDAYGHSESEHHWNLKNRSPIWQRVILSNISKIRIVVYPQRFKQSPRNLAQ